MNKVCYIFLLSFFMIIGLFSSTYANEKKVLIQKYTFQNISSKANKEAQVTVFVGKDNFVNYQTDQNTIITPTPIDYEFDDYGNKYAIIDFSKCKPGESITVCIQREFETSKYHLDIPKGSQATINEENQLYLLPQERVQSDNAEISAKAHELTYELDSAYKKAYALFEFVNTQIDYDFSARFANKGALSALNTKKGVCEEYATLFAAFCRSISIPCRIISGYKFEIDNLSEDGLTESVDGNKLTPHVWNEIWLDDYGWLPVETSIIYGENGKRKANPNTFCQLNASNYIATGIYTGDIVSFKYSSHCLANTDIKEMLCPNLDATVYESENERHSFSDLEGYEWAEEAIERLYEANIIKGYSDDVYRPAGNVTRIQFICLLSRILKEFQYKPNSSGDIYYYSDYNQEHYSKEDYDFLMRCLEDIKPGSSGESIGYSALNDIFFNQIEINKSITREEVVALMDPFLNDNINDEIEFNDINDAKFFNSIIKAASNGLINGYLDGSFKPTHSVTRAEIAVILDRYINK